MRRLLSEVTIPRLCANSIHRGTVYCKGVPKLIGIDYGSRRVGVAVSDDSGSVAFPKTTFPNDGNLMKNLAALIEGEKAEEVVIGESRNAEGKENPVMEQAREFAAELERVSGVSVRYEPEFYTSVEARRDLGHSFIDAEAAAILLNSYITRTRKS